MKRENNILYGIGLTFIALFLFVTHTKYQYDIDPLRDVNLFVFGNFDFKKYVHYFMGAAFAIVATIVIALIKRHEKYFMQFAIVVAILELIGVFIFYNTEIPRALFIWMSSGYYSIYAGFIVFMYAHIKKHEKSEKKELQNNAIAPAKNAKNAKKDKINKLFENGMSIPDIALHLNINKSTVYRNLNK